MATSKKFQKSIESLEKWLQENGISFRRVRFGGSYYKEEPVSVSGLIVSFDSELESDFHHKKMLFLKMMNHKKGLCLERRTSWPIFSYSVLTEEDHFILSEYQERVQADVDAFWEKRHTEKSCVG